uniref:Uncharacterized protein n=1 Tax=Glossina pallidipes TaxID=7398 RepID=A0A1A9Z6T9_GLOPL
MLPDPVEPTTLSRQPAVELLPPEEELASDKGRKLELLEAYKGSISLVMMGVLTGLAIERLNSEKYSNYCFLDKCLSQRGLCVDGLLSKSGVQQLNRCKRAEIWLLGLPTPFSITESLLNFEILSSSESTSMPAKQL